MDASYRQPVKRRLIHVILVVQQQLLCNTKLILYENIFLINYNYLQQPVQDLVVQAIVFLQMFVCATADSGLRAVPQLINKLVCNTFRKNVSFVFFKVVLFFYRLIKTSFQRLFSQGLMENLVEQFVCMEVHAKTDDVFVVLVIQENSAQNVSHFKCFNFFYKKMLY